jgi:hypothetical protein
MIKKLKISLVFEERNKLLFSFLERAFIILDFDKA